MWVDCYLLPKASSCKRIDIVSCIFKDETVLVLIMLRTNIQVKASTLDLHSVWILVELMQLAFTTISIRVNTSK